MKKLLILLPILLASCTLGTQEIVPESPLAITGSIPRTQTEVQVDTNSVQIITGSVIHTIQ